MLSSQAQHTATLLTNHSSLLLGFPFHPGPQGAAELPKISCILERRIHFSVAYKSSLCILKEARLQSKSFRTNFQSQKGFS